MGCQGVRDEGQPPPRPPRGGDRARHRLPGGGAGAGCGGRTPLSRAALAPRGRVPTHLGQGGTQSPAPVCPPPRHPQRHRPWRGGHRGTGGTAPGAAHRSQPAANRPSPPAQVLLPASTASPPSSPPRSPTPPLVTDNRGPPDTVGQHTPIHAPPHHPRVSRVAPAPWRGDTPSSTPPSRGAWGPLCPHRPPVPGS